MNGDKIRSRKTDNGESLRLDWEVPVPANGPIFQYKALVSWIPKNSEQVRSYEVDDLPGDATTGTLEFPFCSDEGQETVVNISMKAKNKNDAGEVIEGEYSSPHQAPVCRNTSKKRLLLFLLFCLTKSLLSVVVKGVFDIVSHIYFSVVLCILVRFWQVTISPR